MPWQVTAYVEHRAGMNARACCEHLVGRRDSLLEVRESVDGCLARELAFLERVLALRRLADDLSQDLRHPVVDNLKVRCCAHPVCYGGMLRRAGQQTNTDTQPFHGLEKSCVRMLIHLCL